MFKYAKFMTILMACACLCRLQLCDVSLLCDDSIPGPVMSTWPASRQSGRHLVMAALLENWLRIGVTCVKWGNVFSIFMRCHVEFDKAVFFRRICLQYIYR